jgi:hypothetical protein
MRKIILLLPILLLLANKSLTKDQIIDELLSFNKSKMATMFNGKILEKQFGGAKNKDNFMKAMDDSTINFVKEMRDMFNKKYTQKQIVNLHKVLKSKLFTHNYQLLSTKISDQVGFQKFINNGAMKLLSKTKIETINKIDAIILHKKGMKNNMDIMIDMMQLKMKGPQRDMVVKMMRGQFNTITDHSIFFALKDLSDKDLISFYKLINYKEIKMYFKKLGELQKESSKKLLTIIMKVQKSKVLAPPQKK